MTKVDGCISSFNYTPSTAVLVHFDGNFFIRKCANSAISSHKQVVHLSTKDWCWMNPLNCLLSLLVVFYILSPFFICLTSTEPSVAPPRVWARTLSASEIEVFWIPVHQSGSKGRITGYEVHKHHKWREGKKRLWPYTASPQSDSLMYALRWWQGVQFPVPQQESVIPRPHFSQSHLQNEEVFSQLVLSPGERQYPGFLGTYINHLSDVWTSYINSPSCKHFSC